ncbi:MAG: hypothetical protein M9894_09645 [Planctomycetes bacterium]|nr:hypothetical protein [Planctomycetota bacterium]
MARKPQRGGKRRASLAGTHLFVKPSTGIYWWRRKDPDTGKRIKRTTGTRVLEAALKKAQEFEKEFEQRQAGLTVVDGWQLELLPLAEEWLVAEAHAHSERWAPQKRRHLFRALDLLGLRRARDLDNLARLHDRLLALPRFTRTTKRRSFQETLKQFSAWLAANKRYLDRDPLAHWTPIKPDPPTRRRRSLLPDEMARAVQAMDRLDAHYGRRPQRCLLVTLLVAGPRIGALLSRDVEHLDHRNARIDLGANVGKKRRGAAALDPKTLAELDDYLDGRTEGPLFLAARGGRPTAHKVLDQVREAFGLAFVDELWPEDEPPQLDLAMLVNCTLLHGAVPKLSGNPNLVTEKTRAARAKLEERVMAIAGQLRREWERRMQGVDVHALRKTHRSWAQARGVPPVLIDKQLGHADPGEFEVMRALAGSETGRKHYLDLGSELFDAGRSAQAVRELLDEAMGRVSFPSSRCGVLSDRAAG